MIKLCILVIWAGAWTGVLGVTQEQLAQYVAAQQTAPHKHQQVAVLSRPRQAYALQQAAEDAGDEAYQQAYQAAYQQAAAASYQPQPAPQATSSKYFSSSVGLSAAKNYAPVAAAPAAPQYYRPAPAPQYQTKLRPLPAGPVQEAEPEDYDPNPAYQFSFDVKDDEFTNYQNRKEQREGDKISGSYSVVDSDGYIRTVTYTADPKEGFKAEVSREPTEIRVKLPQPPQALPQQYQQIPQQLVRKQQTQQYLEPASPAVHGAPQYAVRPHFVAPQFVAAPQFAAAPAPKSASTGKHVLCIVMYLMLQAESPAVHGSPQYAVRPQSVAYVAPQFVAAPQFTAAPAPSSASTGKHVLCIVMYLMLQAASPAVHGAPQYAVRPQSVAYVAPQFVAAPQFTAAPAPSSASTGKHVLCIVMYLMLQAASPAVHGAPQYAVRPQSVAYVAPQFVAAPQYAAAPAPKSAYTGQHRLAAPVKPKASAIGYAAQQPTAGNPILYQAYQP